MRTARALVPLIDGQRPNSAVSLVEAAEAITRLAGDAEPLTPVRFAGYSTAADLNLGNTLDQMSTGTRFAVYEADFADALVQ